MPLAVGILSAIEGFAFRVAEANEFRDALGPVFVLAASCVAVVLAMSAFVLVWRLLVDRS